MLKIDPTAVISPLADIERSVRGTLIEIGPGVLIDSFVKIKAAGGSGEVIIGADSAVNSGTVIYTGNGVRIGEGVLIARSGLSHGNAHGVSFRGLSHESNTLFPLRALIWAPFSGLLQDVSDRVSASLA